MEISRIDRKPGLLQSLGLLTIARRDHVKLDPAETVLQTWRKLQTLPFRNTYLYLLTCPDCSLDTPPSGLRDWQSLYKRRVTIPEAFVPSCVLCNAIRCCFLHFAFDVSISQCQVLHAAAGYTTLNYYSDDDESKSVTVQLYSKGLRNRRNPFRVSMDVCPDPRGSDMILRIQSWITDCTRNHDYCARPRTPSMLHEALPSRLIKVEKDQVHFVHLVSPTRLVQFAALSYCWGSTKQPVTTNSNLSSRYRQIISYDLPQTLQDGIHMTRALGLEYIWIDSICIIQDDEHDWATESAKMGHIFMGAWIVLAATMSSDCSDGFLRRRKDKLILGPSQLGHDAPIIYSRQINNHGYFMNIELESFPLFQRGWCMQERQLARRIVHFLPDELYFECDATYYCECGLVPVVKLQRELTQSPFRVMMAALDASNPTPTSFGVRWGEILQEYSRLTLTDKTDTLPALSGLAQRMLPFKPGAYVAGLWGKDVAYLLSWRCDGEATAAQAATSGPRQPTFSWISCSSPIKYFEKRFWSPIAEYLCSETVQATANPFGHVSSGTLRLSGFAVEGLNFTRFIEYASSSRSEYCEYCLVFLDTVFQSPCSESVEGDKSVNRKFHTGWEQQISDWSPIICFALYTWTYDEIHHYVDMLLLQRKPDVDEYVRIGVVDGLHKNWYDEHSFPATVTIT